MSDANKLIDAIANLREAFFECGLEAPATITLKSASEGFRFLEAMQHLDIVESEIYLGCARPPISAAEIYDGVIAPDGWVWLEVKIMDVVVRWPTHQRLTPEQLRDHGKHKGGFYPTMI